MYDIRTAQRHRTCCLYAAAEVWKHGSDANHEPLNAPAVLLAFAQEV